MSDIVEYNQQAKIRELTLFQFFLAFCRLLIFLITLSSFRSFLTLYSHYKRKVGTTRECRDIKDIFSRHKYLTIRIESKTITKKRKKNISILVIIQENTWNLNSSFCSQNDYIFIKQKNKKNNYILYLKRMQSPRLL